MSFDPFVLKVSICSAVFSLCASEGRVAFHTSVVSSFLADEEEALNSIMKDLAALGKCGGLLDNNRNKNSVHSNKQVWLCSFRPPQAPADTEEGRVLAMLAEQSLNVRTEVNKCSAHQKYHHFTKLGGL